METLAIYGLDLARVEGWLEVGGYFTLFSLLFLCGLGLPVPEDIPLLLAGVFIFHGKMHLLPVGLLAWTGIIGGDCVLYYLGKKYGMNITKLPMVGKHVTETRIKKMEDLYAHYGVWVVAICRLFAGIRGAMVAVAGAIRFNFVKFVITDGLAALISGGLWIWLGHWGGKVFHDPKDLMTRAEPYKFWIGLGVLTIVICVGVYLYVIKSHKKAKSGDETISD